MPTIHVAAVWVSDEAGRVLAVRKRGTTAFMQPGGKLEPGETAQQCAVRELREEVGLQVTPTFVGHFVEAAANEPGHLVDAMVFRAPLDGEPRAAAEIEELIWLDPTRLPADGVLPGGHTIAPLLRRLAAQLA